MSEIGLNYNSRTNACCVGRCTFSSKERYLLGQNTTCSVAFCRNKWCSVEQFMGLDLVLGCWQSFTFQIFEKKVSEMRRACSQTATTGRKVSGA